MDRQRVNLDGFAIEDPELGLTALRSPHDPAPSLTVTDGRVTELDTVPEAEFDSIDTYIARHGLDLSVAAEAMALSDVALARLCGPNRRGSRCRCFPPSAPPGRGRGRATSSSASRPRSAGTCGGACPAWP